MLDQYTLIWNTNWKYLIILDACRYDYFEKVYKDYGTLRSGKLKRAISPGSSTTEWLEAIFQGRECKYVIYISANPYVNSKGLPYRGFNPKPIISRFYRVIDVWDWGWNEELSTVHPKEVNKAVLITKRLYPDKRLIIHYIQPHFPYLSLAQEGIKIAELRIYRERGPTATRFIDKVRGFIRWKIFLKLMGDRGLKLAFKLVGKPLEYNELIAHKLGMEGLRRAYEENLKLVLSYVDKLVPHLKGKGLVIITADHGELLGERGLFDHPERVRVPELVEVPWLEIGSD